MAYLVPTRHAAFLVLIAELVVVPSAAPAQIPFAGGAPAGQAPAAPMKTSVDAADFPADVPRLSNVTRAAYSITGTAALAFFVTLATPGDVSAFYQRFVDENGWERVALPGPPPKSDRIVIARKGGRVLRVDAVVNPLRGSTEVFVSVAEKPAAPVKSREGRAADAQARVPQQGGN